MTTAELGSPDFDFSAMLEEHGGLVGSIAKEFLRRGLPYDELVASGTVGLWLGCVGFKPELGFKPSTYLSRAIRWEIQSELRRGRIFGTGGESLDQHEAVDYRGDTSPSDGIARRERTEHARQLVAGLPTRERIAISAYYGLDGGGPMTLDQIAISLRTSRTKIRETINSALRRMRGYA